MIELTKAEEQVMREVWKAGKIFIREIIEQLPDPKPAYNTIGTFLKILENKGFVLRKKYGNTYEYSSKISKSKYTSFILKGFITKYFDGSTEQMLSYFVRNKDLDIKTFEEFSNKMRMKKS